MSDTISIQRWPRVRSESVTDCRVFKVRKDFIQDPRDGNVHDFYCIEAPDWINVIPLTADRKVLMIEQYRHGTDEITLEIPGGMIDQGESPVEAAARELREETGHQAECIRSLGETRPNPAILNNTLHTFVAEGCIQKEAPQLDGLEHIAIRFVPLKQINSLIADGTINHALVVVAFYRLLMIADI